MITTHQVHVMFPRIHEEIGESNLKLLCGRDVFRLTNEDAPAVSAFGDDAAFKLLEGASCGGDLSQFEI
jgi:hypothetical protein